MDAQHFDKLTQGAAYLPDRRNMLKVVGAAALTGIAGAALRPEATSADHKDNHQRGLVNVVITNLIDDVTVEIPVKNNNVALQICAAVEAINVELFAVDTLECEIEQRQ